MTHDQTMLTNAHNLEIALPALAKALTGRGYLTLTPVQAAVFQSEYQTDDLLVSAQTGSGKTVAFGLAMGRSLLADQAGFAAVETPLALVIAPTRELALQVKAELSWLFAHAGAVVTTCVGGMDMRTERRNLACGPHIVVGTPGRLCDHIKRGSLDTQNLQVVVLDEADEMLDMGFRAELETILDTTPPTRRTLLFSATLPKAIMRLAKRYQHQAQHIALQTERVPHADIEYQALTVAPSDQEGAIFNVLRYHEAKNALVFCRTRAEVNHLASRLADRQLSVVSLSGELSQSRRTQALQALRDGRANVCVATDVAARGIDLPDLALVIHADVPQNRDLLLHRSGRTGRAGRQGMSVLIVPPSWRTRAQRLLASAHIDATWQKPPTIAQILERDRQRFLAHPCLTQPIQPAEQDAIDALLRQYAPEQIAAALWRLQDQQRAAPEELLDVPPEAAPVKKQQRKRRKPSIKPAGKSGSSDPEKAKPTRHKKYAKRKPASATRSHKKKRAD